MKPLFLRPSRWLPLRWLSLVWLLGACSPTLHDFEPGKDTLSHDGDVAPTDAATCSTNADAFAVRIIDTWIYNALPDTDVQVLWIKAGCVEEDLGVLGPGQRLDTKFGSDDVMQVRLTDGTVHSTWIFNSTSNFPEAAVVVLPTDPAQ